MDFEIKSKQSKQKGMFHIINDYSGYSTIQGIIYIFKTDQSLAGRLVWISIVAFMILLGAYWSLQSYADWKNNPVLTTVATMAYPVKAIELPAVTICRQGMSDDVIGSAMLNQFFKYLELKNISIGVNPYKAQNLIFIQIPNPNHKPLFLLLKKIIPIFFSQTPFLIVDGSHKGQLQGNILDYHLPEPGFIWDRIKGL